MIERKPHRVVALIDGRRLVVNPTTLHEHERTSSSRAIEAVLRTDPHGCFHDATTPVEHRPDWHNEDHAAIERRAAAQWDREADPKSRTPQVWHPQGDRAFTYVTVVFTGEELEALNSYVRVNRPTAVWALQPAFMGARRTILEAK